MGRNGTTFQPYRSQIQAILPLIPKVIDAKDQDKTKLIQLEVKDHAGEVGSKTYKRYIRIFEEDSAQEWIELIQNMRIIWNQNGTVGGRDRAAQFRAALAGDSLSTFDSYIDDQRLNPDPVDPTPIPYTPEMVENAIQAVSANVFPFQALENQKRWMQRELKKPKDMLARKFSSQLTRLNNSLPFFPDGDESSTFDEKELTAIMEYALPQSWRDKFDLKGFVPAHEKRMKLIAECEIIERYEATHGKNKEEGHGSHSNNKSNNKNSKETQSANKKPGNKPETRTCHYCKKPGHVEAKCRQKQRDEKAKGSEKTSHGGAGKAEEKTAFSKRTFRKELNAITKKANKNGCMEILQATLARASKSSKGKAGKKTDSEDEADSDESVHVLTMEDVIPRKNQRAASPPKLIAMPPTKTKPVSKQQVKWVMRSDETDMVLAEAKAKDARLAAALARSEADNARIKHMLLTNKSTRKKTLNGHRPQPVEFEPITVESDEENEAYVASLLQSDEESPDVEMTDTEE